MNFNNRGGNDYRYFHWFRFFQDSANYCVHILPEKQTNKRLIINAGVFSQQGSNKNLFALTRIPLCWVCSVDAPVWYPLSKLIVNCLDTDASLHCDQTSTKDTTTEPRESISCYQATLWSLTTSFHFLCAKQMWPLLIVSLKIVKKS